MREFEEAFLEQTEADRQRREEVTRATTMRTHSRRLEKQHKHGTMRFVLLVLLLITDGRRRDRRDVRDALHGHGLATAPWRDRPAKARPPGGTGRRSRPDGLSPRPPTPLAPTPAAQQSRSDDGGGVLLLLDLQVDLLAEHRDVPRGLDADPDLLAHDREHRHLDVVPDHDALIRLPGQDQHFSTASERESAPLERASDQTTNRRRWWRKRNCPSQFSEYRHFTGRRGQAHGRGTRPPLGSRDRWHDARCKPQLNQIRTWVRQGRTDAWIAHQLEITVQQIQAFKREHELEPDGAPDAVADLAADIDLRAEDDALIAAELEEEAARKAEEDARKAEEDAAKGDDDEGEDEDGGAPRRRRGRRGGRGRRARRIQATSRAASTTARRATACGSTPPSPTIPCTPSTGRATAR